MSDHPVSPQSAPRTDAEKRSSIRIEISVSKAFLNQAAGLQFDRNYYFNPNRRRSVDAQCHAYVEQHLSDLGAFYTESNLGRKAHFEPRQVLVGGIQPNLILGMLLGAEFLPNPAGDADIAPDCWAGKPMEDLPAPEDLPAHPVIRQFTEQVTSLAGDPKVAVIPPFFWDASGRAAIHGALTTAQKFLGAQIMMDLLAEPERVRQMMTWITRAMIVLVRHFADLSGIVISNVHVGECSSCMVGAAEWSSFVAPTLESIAHELGPVRLHSCGPSNHLLQSARQVHGISSLDVGGETSIGKVRELFGFDFPVSIAPPVKLLADGMSDGLAAWTRRVLAENQNGELTFLCHLEPYYSIDVLRTWHKNLLNSAK